jgi:hypothetical protein
MFALRFFEMQADESVMHLKDLAPGGSVASDPGTEEERRELRVERHSVGESTLRKLVAWLDDGRRQQAAPVQRSKASGSAGVATRRVALARETRFGRRPKLSRPASELELDKSNDRSFSAQMPKGVPTGVCQRGRFSADLSGNKSKHLRWKLLSWQPRSSRVAQQVELDRKTEPKAVRRRS